MKSLKLILKEAGYLRFETAANQLQSLELLPMGQGFVNQFRCEWFRSFTSNNSVIVPRAQPPTTVQELQTLPAYLLSKEIEHVRNFAQTSLNCKPPLSLFDQLLSTKPLGISENLFCTHLIPQEMAQEKFLRLQRERKIWWMKHFSNPTTQSLSEVTIEGKLQHVTLQQNTNLIEQLPLENIELLTDVPQNEKVAAIRLSTNLELAAFALLSDAATECKFNALDLHRKLAPIQVCFFYNLEGVEGGHSDLLDLGKLLAIKTRKTGIKCLNSDAYEVTSDGTNIYDLADKLGIPYGIQLDGESLRSGLIKLRSRKAKLLEVIHVSDIPNYLVKIFQP